MPGTNFSAPEFLEQLRAHDSAAWVALVEAYLLQLLRTGYGILR